MDIACLPQYYDGSFQCNGLRTTLERFTYDSCQTYYRLGLPETIALECIVFSERLRVLYRIDYSYGLLYQRIALVDPRVYPIYSQHNLASRTTVLFRIS